MQRRVARQRSGFDEPAYINALSVSSVRPDVASALYRRLLSLCTKGVLPHPDDGLLNFYFDEPEDLEDLLEDLYTDIGLPLPARYDPEITPHLKSVRDLAMLLDAKLP